MCRCVIIVGNNLYKHIYMYICLKKESDKRIKKNSGILH